VQQASPLRELTCYMESHSVTCHPAEVTFGQFPPITIIVTGGWAYIREAYVWTPHQSTHSSAKYAGKTAHTPPLPQADGDCYFATFNCIRSSSHYILLTARALSHFQRSLDFTRRSIMRLTALNCVHTEWVKNSTYLKTVLLTFSISLIQYYFESKSLAYYCLATLLHIFTLYHC